RPDLVDRGGAVSDRRRAGCAQHPQRLHQAVAAFGGSGRSFGQGRFGGGVCIELVGLTPASSLEPVRLIDFDDCVARVEELPGDSSAVAAGAFNTYLEDL